MTRQLVWYAAYGSNLSRVRFAHYLRGGTPVGAKHTYPGSRDTSAPLDDRPWELELELVFGGASRTWGGGVAFVDSSAGQIAKARLYLITLEQFEDVVAQENWLAPGSVVLGPHDREMDVGTDHTYGLVLPLAELEGRPILTVTQRRGTRIARPSVAYLKHIADGLREAHGMGPDQVVDYFLSKRGVAGEFTLAELEATVRSSG